MMMHCRTMVDLEVAANDQGLSCIPPLLVPLSVLRSWLREASWGGDGFLEVAYLAGRSLIARKRRCPSGAWQVWQKDVLGVGTRTAAACVRVFLSAQRHGGAVPENCFGRGLWSAEQALPWDSSRASASIKPDPDATARPVSHYHAEMLYGLAANKPLLQLLSPALEHIRDSDNPLAAANYLAAFLLAYGQVDANPFDDLDQRAE